MKHLLTVIILLGTFLAVSAKEPDIALTQAFDGRFNNHKGVSLSTSRSPGNYFFSITIDNNQDISKQLQKWIEHDEKNATTVVESIEHGDRDVIMILEPGPINVGIEYSGGMSFPSSVWMQSSSPFIKTKK